VVQGLGVDCERISRKTERYLSQGTVLVLVVLAELKNARRWLGPCFCYNFVLRVNLYDTLYDFTFREK
jgi:hypothetical protein